MGWNRPVLMGLAIEVRPVEAAVNTRVLAARIQFVHGT
jgi:hypothetical protein